jgi:transposase
MSELLRSVRVPDAMMRDQPQMLIHRHKLVQIRTRVKNELQHLMRLSKWTIRLQARRNKMTR